MNSAILPRSRVFSRVCDACRQQHQLVTPTSVSRRSISSPSRTTPRGQGRHAAATTPRAQSRWLSRTAPVLKPSEPASSSSSTSPSAAAVPQSHYDFFPESIAAGPPPAGPFEIDVRALRREFLQLQAKAHPDLHPQEHKSRAEATSARINEAFRTLAAPLQRAQYLLARRGYDVANDEAAKVEDPELLMAVLEARELIEDAASEADLEPLRAENDERITESELELARAFREDDLEAAKRETTRLRYWVNVKESLHNWEPGKPVVLEH